MRVHHNKIVISAEKVTECTGFRSQGVGRGGPAAPGVASVRRGCWAQSDPKDPLQNKASAVMVVAPLGNCLGQGKTAQTEKAGTKRMRKSRGNTKVT